MLIYSAVKRLKNFIGALRVLEIFYNIYIILPEMLIAR